MQSNHYLDQLYTAEDLDLAQKSLGHHFFSGTTMQRLRLGGYVKAGIKDSSADACAGPQADASRSCEQ